MPNSLSSRIASYLSLVVLLTGSGVAQVPAPTKRDPFRDFAFRSLGPSLTTGRISDVAVDPKNPNVWYVAAASGNLWKTENRGDTFEAVFDNYGSYSLGVVTVDPKDSNTVWLGTGENNNQRSVSYGDGVYKSGDAGKTWKRMGLDNSEHIQNIIGGGAQNHRVGSVRQNGVGQQMAIAPFLDHPMDEIVFVERARLAHRADDEIRRVIGFARHRAAG